MTGAPLLFGGMRRLAGTVTDGYAPEGFSILWAYLWHAEHALLFVWIGAALAIVLGRSGWNAPRKRSATTWVLAAAFIYLGLGVTSAILHLFVVMGRQSRQLVAFRVEFPSAAAAALSPRREPVDRLP